MEKCELQENSWQEPTVPVLGLLLLSEGGLFRLPSNVPVSQYRYTLYMAPWGDVTVNPAYRYLYGGTQYLCSCTLANRTLRPLRALSWLFIRNHSIQVRPCAHAMHPLWVEACL